MATIKISKPDDSNEVYSTTITCNTYNFRNYQVSYVRSKSDPILAGLENYWKNIISYNPRRYNTSFGKTFTHLVVINGCPILLSKMGIRYEANGKSYSFANLCSALARLTYKSCFEDDAAKLLSAFYSTLKLPENVKYALENRVPYHWYEILESPDPIQVRLSCQQIGDNEIAIEISDGIWGTMTVKQLDVFCNYYRHEKNRGSWVNTSPKELFTRTMGRSPSESDMVLMKAFLSQNRTQDLVEARAIELVNELLAQYPDRLSANWENGQLESLIVKGKDYDWLLNNNNFKSDIQMVSTYVWQPSYEKQATGVDENDKTIYRTIVQECEWKGPICIDNMAKGSSVGDQFAARALALLNDRFTITIVNTISRYLTANPNEYRVDENADKNL